MEKPKLLEEMSPEEQEAEIQRRLRAAWRVVIRSRERRAREKVEQENLGLQAS